jgi:hypothetical protein
MDICTLVMVTTMNAIGCVADPVCRPSPDGTKHLCTPGYCPLPAPVYDCKRPDGSTYTWRETDAGAK